MAAQPQQQLPLWLDGLPHGNPPRTLAFKLKAALHLQATPTLLMRQSGALVLPASANDEDKLRKAATQPSAPADEDAGYAILEHALGPGVRLLLRGTGGAAMPANSRSETEHPVDGRPWGPHVMRRTADSNLAAAQPDRPLPPPEHWEIAHGVVISETARCVVRGGGTDPKGLTVARGGFDDHLEEGTYLCAGCHSPLYSSEMKWDCGCGWPGFWSCIKDALYERRDGARGEIRCVTCDGHIGHVYRGEGYNNPPPNERHCANSSALVFQPLGSLGDSGLVRPAYAGAVYMSTYTEDDLTVYTNLSGPEPQLRLYSYVKGFGPHIAYEADRVDSRCKGAVETAVFAMGCFWHAEVVFGGVEGVVATEVGFVQQVEVPTPQHHYLVIRFDSSPAAHWPFAFRSLD